MISSSVNVTGFSACLFIGVPHEGQRIVSPIPVKLLLSRNEEPSPSRSTRREICPCGEYTHHPATVLFDQIPCARLRCSRPRRSIPGPIREEPVESVRSPERRRIYPPIHQQYLPVCECIP